MVDFKKEREVKKLKLRQIVYDKSDLTLSKEKKVVKYNEVFIIKDNKRAHEILKTTYHKKPVVEEVKENVQNQE